ncbi:hypothetical protein BYT27DRAFT_6398864 [Phlegmacium glaucopus]|nr:hypothetical protein BYT27DRAFT_6398864 [Phlegmacium glaucopus]
MSLIQDVQYYIRDLVIECPSEDSEQGVLPTTMDVVMFGPEKTTREILLFEKISSRQWQHKDAIRLMDEITFCATWDESGSYGILHLKRSELGEFTTSAGSHDPVRSEKRIPDCNGPL